MKISSLHLTVPTLGDAQNLRLYEPPGEYANALVSFGVVDAWVARQPGCSGLRPSAHAGYPFL